MKINKNYWRILFICLIIFLSVFYLLCTTHREEATREVSVSEGFTSLFNGKDLTGWVVEPDNGAYFVKAGSIHCAGEPRPPYVALSEKEYENFILEVDFKISPNGNSGIFFQTPIDGRQSKNGFELQIQGDAGSPASPWCTGALYDLVAPDTNANRPAGQWNHYKIELDWPLLKIWLNGVQIHDRDFSTDHQLRYRRRMGFIGLQNHNSPVEFKNIFIKELPGKIQYESLFNGKDLTGWRTIGDANWHVENGAVLATEGSGYLISEKTYQNFEFMTYTRIFNVAYGGIYYRWLSADDPGYLAEFYNLQDAIEYTKQFAEHQTPQDVLPVHRRYTWFPYQIIAFDRQSEVRQNGIISNTNLTMQKIRPGHIVFHFHPDSDSLIISDMKIRQLESW
jgi:hypothetical protein